MTFCETLKETTRKDGRTVTAQKSTDKDGATRYEIIVSKDGIAESVIKTARTTWKKAFKAEAPEEATDLTELAQRIADFFEEFDPYGFTDEYLGEPERAVTETLELLESDPEEVSDQLTEMVEELYEDEQDDLANEGQMIINAITAIFWPEEYEKGGMLCGY